MKFYLPVFEENKDLMRTLSIYNYFVEINLNLNIIPSIEEVEFIITLIYLNS